MAVRKSIDITKAEKEAMEGKKMNDTHFFAPVLRENGSWCISIQCRDMITNPLFLYLKDREPEDYKNIQEATDLSKCLTSENLDNSDLDTIYTRLSEHNSLVNPVIRPSGIHSTSMEAKNNLMDKGIILVDDE